MSKATYLIHCKQNMGKNSGKNLSTSISSKYGQKLLDTQKSQQLMLLRLPQRGQAKNQQNQHVIWLEIRLQEKL